jgi:hypothetical protein
MQSWATSAMHMVLELPNGDLAIFDSRKKAVAHMKSVMPDSVPN